MGELAIYDSQGQQFDSAGPGRDDERIKDFFFDGVRFALDMHLANEAIIFFRARNNETARSEQYYAVYKFQHQSELPQLGDEIRRVIEDEHGMILDTGQEDTDVFEYLVGDRSEERRDIKSPGDRETKDDLSTLLDQGQNLHVGVDSYRSACGVFTEFADRSNVAQIAIADTVSSSRLDDYDMLVEVGSHHGLEPLGDTADRLESLRERRRQRIQANATGDTSSGSGGPVGRILDADTWAVDFAIGLVILALLSSGIVFGACTINGGPAALSDVPLLGDGCASEETVRIDTVEYDAGADAFLVNGSVDSSVDELNATFNVSREDATNSSGNGSMTMISRSYPALNISSGVFNESVPNNGTFRPQSNQLYWLNLTTDSADRVNHSFEIREPANESSNQSTATATPTPEATTSESNESTTTDTPSPTPTSTLTPINEPAEQNSSAANRTSTATATASPTPSSPSNTSDSGDDTPSANLRSSGEVLSQSTTSPNHSRAASAGRQPLASTGLLAMAGLAVGFGTRRRGE